MKEVHQFQASCGCCMKACLFSVSQTQIHTCLVCFYSLTQMLTFLNLGVLLSTILCKKLSLRKVHNREGFYILSRGHTSRQQVLYSRKLLPCKLGALSGNPKRRYCSNTKFVYFEFFISALVAYCLFHAIPQYCIKPYLECFYSLTQMFNFLNLGVSISYALCTILSLIKVDSREGFYILSRGHSSR